MTNIELRARLAEAVEASNRYFDAGRFHLARRWHLRAVELQRQLATGESV